MKIKAFKQQTWAGTLVALILLSQGCATVEKPEPLTPQLIDEPKPVKEVEPVKKVIVKPDVEILLSGNAKSYSRIADQLNTLLEKPAKLHTLSGNKISDELVVNDIASSPHKQIVAIGLRAAKAVRHLKHKQIIFSQVFNHHEHNLVSENMKGVSVMPSPDELFKDWKTLSPKLQHVLVISGTDLDDYIAIAKTAARQQGINLIHQVVNNDKEFIYNTKHKQHHTQGHWLLADNRVLSIKVLKEVMAFNAKEGIQTVVFQPKLLSFGGLMYVSPSAREISQTILSRLKQSIDKDKVIGDDVALPEDHDMGINAMLAKQIGVTIPASFKEFIHE